MRKMRGTDDDLLPRSSTGSLPLPAMPAAPAVRAGAVSRPPGKSRRLNMSFSNEEARRIQRENELLLRRIVGQRARQPRLGPPGAPASREQQAGQRAAAASPAPPWPPSAHRCSHAVNRARRTRDIERENQVSPAREMVP